MRFSNPVRRDLLLLLALALLIRALAALPQQQPNYMDAAYSYVNALNLAAGRGFEEDFVWNYLDNPQPPPHPSHLYWMPLTSILAWLGMLVGGATYRAAQIAFIILSALLAPISYVAAYFLSNQRRSSWLAGLLAIFSGFYFPFWTAIDNFTPFAIAGSLALFFAGVSIINYQLSITNNQERLFSQVLPLPCSPAPLLLCSGLFTGLAHLARADGPLLLLVIILIILLHSTRSTRQTPRTTHYAPHITYCVVRSIFVLLLGYLLIMLPWFIRNWQAIGSPLPAAGSQTMWLTGYDDLFSYQRDLSAQTFFAQGFAAVIRGRWWAFTTNLQTVLAVWGMIFVLPLTVIGVWHLRRHVLIQLTGMYAGLLFIALTFIFAFPGARGGLFHSGAALLPFIYGAAVVGLDKAVDWVAARRRGWRAQSAKRVFGAGLVVMAIALSSFIYYQRVLKNNTWNTTDSLYPAIAVWVSAQNPTATVMIGNPPAYRYHGGGLSVIIPNENLNTTLQAASEYQVDFLILDSNHPAPLTEVYDNPTAFPTLRLAQTFGEGEGGKIYVFEVIR